MNINAMTKAQLIAHSTLLEAELLERNLQLKDTRDELHYHMNKPAYVYAQQPVRTHKAYYEYIGQCRAAARARGTNVVQYKTFAQWCAA
jgi:hypothetical protein